MKKIVVPVDFSIASKNALNYAIELADQLNYEIEVLHIYAGLMNVNEPLVIRSGLNREESLLVDLNYLINTDETDGNTLVLPDVKITPVLRQGITDIEILERSKEEDCGMIVMGTTGSHGIAGKFFGSISTNTARAAGCPVLLIPKDVSYKPIRHILVASNYESIDPNLVNQCALWANLLSTTLKFIYVEGNQDPYEFEDVRQVIVDTLFIDQVPPFSFEINKVHSHSVAEGLHDYAQDAQVGLIIMVAPKKNFFQEIFHKSCTKEMAFNTEVPLMVFHK